MNGAIETIYEIQANGDLIKILEKCGKNRDLAQIGKKNRRGIKTKGLERSIQISR